MDLSNENVIHVKNNGIEYLQFRKLLSYPDIKHIYSLGKQDYRTAKPNKEPFLGRREPFYETHRSFGESPFW